MTADSPDVGAAALSALSKAAELGVATQLEEAQDLTVDIDTDPRKLIQGKVDSIDLSGKGLVTSQNLRLEAVDISVNQVEINPLSAFFGKFKFAKPAQADAHIVLTEADINTALNTGPIQHQLRSLTMTIGGQLMTVEAQATVRLPGDHKIVVAADFLLKEKNEVKKILATVIPSLQKNGPENGPENGNRISLEILSAEGQGLTAEFAIAILHHLKPLLDLRNLSIPGISLQFRQLDVQPGKLIIQAKGQIEQIPST